MRNSAKLLFCLLALCGCDRKSEPLGPAPAPPSVDLGPSLVLLADTLSREVEWLRGASFTRPVRTVVYTRSEYEQKVVSESLFIRPPSDSLRNAVNKLLACEGFLRPGEDYFSNYSGMLAVAVGGFYVDGTDTLYVIVDDTATGIDPDTRAILFHELTHALQDQRYGLDSLIRSRTTSDRSFSATYMVEGEAQYLDNLYSYLLYAGGYPADRYAFSLSRSASWIASCNAYADDLRATGTPYFVSLPFIWPYGWGYAFITDAVGTSPLSRIDGIFTDPPVRMREIFRPDRYLARDRGATLADVSVFMDTLYSRRAIRDYDEFGELYFAVLFKTWGFSNYEDIARGLRCDRVAASDGPDTGAYSVYMLTQWESVADASVFASACSTLLARKHGGAWDAAAGTVAGVTAVIRQDSSRVTVMENFPEDRRSADLALLQASPVLDWPAGLVKAATARDYPRVGKGGTDGIRFGKGRLLRDEAARQRLLPVPVR